MTMRVGLIKAVPEQWELKRNWERFCALAERAAREKCDILCTPECFLDGYVVTDKEWTPRRFARIFQPLNGGYLKEARRLAKALRLHILFGFTQKARGGAYNAAALLDDRGKLVGVYHKTHLLDHDRRYLPGRDLPVFRTRFGRLGVLICADRRWPEAARTLRVKGAEILFIPSYGMWSEANEWWMRTRAYENETFLCFVHPRVAFIAGPKGDIEAKLQSNKDDLLIHDVDLGLNSRVMLDNRRPELYRSLATRS